MTSRIITKKGSGAPLTSDLVHGELAVDTVNKRLYTEDAGGSIIELGTSPSTIDINAGTIDGTVIGGSTAAAGTFTTGQFNTSLNVDGTVAADGLTVTGSDAALAASIGTNAQRVYITPSGTVINYNASGNSSGSHMFQTGNANRLNIDSNGDISFYEDTGTTATFFWDASEESLGIGTSSPNRSSVNIHGSNRTLASTTSQLAITTSDAVAADIGGSLHFGAHYDTGADFAPTGYIAGRRETATTNDFAGYLQFGVTQDSAATIEAMRIASSGNVGIGVTSPAAKLEIGGAGEGIILASPDGTRYEITVANGGTLTVTAV
jgi:hypothetical protein